MSEVTGLGIVAALALFAAGPHLIATFIIWLAIKWPKAAPMLLKVYCDADEEMIERFKREVGHK